MSSLANEPKREGKLFPTRQQFFDTYQPQSLTFRNTIIDYVLKNPSSQKLYQKLIRCCKLFFIKYPILIIRELDHQCSSTNEEATWHYSLKNNCCFFADYKVYSVNSLICKVWITEKLRIGNTGTNGIKKLIPKLHRCDATNLSLYCTEMTDVYLRIISKCAKEVHMNYVSVIDGSGEQMPLEDVMEIFSTADTFINSHGNDIKDYNKLVNICSTFKSVGLNDLCDEFDVDMFVKLLEETKCETTIYYQRKSDNTLAWWKPLKPNQNPNGYFSEDSSSEEDTEMSEDSINDDYDMSSNIEDSELSESSNIVDSDSS